MKCLFDFTFLLSKRYYLPLKRRQTTVNTLLSVAFGSRILQVIIRMGKRFFVKKDQKIRRGQGRDVLYGGFNFLFLFFLNYPILYSV